MVRLRVINGTLPDVRLCDTCRWSHIEKDAAGHEEIYCGMRTDKNSRVTRKIVECNEYRNMLEKTEKEFEQTAWILNVKGKTILGFVPPKKHDRDDD